MKVLVTGFEPFGGESRNPSAEVVKRLPDQIAGADILKLILPVTRYEAPKGVEAAMEEYQPDVVLSIGQAGGRSAISVERVAVNLDDYRIPDNGENQPMDEAVVEGGPDAYLCQLAVKEMVAAIQKEGIPAQVSMTAGTYVCNHLLYSVSHLVATRYPRAKAGFIHIPFLPEQVTDKPGQPSMSLELSTKAIQIAIETIVKKTC